MNNDYDIVDIFAQYLERAVQGARGNVITFSSSTVIHMWGKWFNHGRAPMHLLYKMSRLLSMLASCNLLRRRKYKYQLERGSSLWDAAERGNVREYLKRVSCYVIATYVERG